MNFESLERRASPRPEIRPNKRWHGIDRPSWRSFFIAMLALAAALISGAVFGSGGRGRASGGRGAGGADGAGDGGLGGADDRAGAGAAHSAALAHLPDRLQTDARRRRVHCRHFRRRPGGAQYRKQPAVHGAGMPAGGRAGFGAALAAGAQRDRSAPHAARTYFCRTCGDGYRRAGKYEAIPAVVFYFADQRGKTETQKGPARPLLRRAFSTGPSTSRTFPTSRPCGRTSS